jgi:hypothetical protein
VTKVHFSLTPDKPEQLSITICPLATGGVVDVLELFLLQLVKMKLIIKMRKIFKIEYLIFANMISS